MEDNSKSTQKKTKEWTKQDDDEFYENYWNKKEKTCLWCEKKVTGSLYGRAFGETYKKDIKKQSGFCSRKCAREGSPR